MVGSMARVTRGRRKELSKAQAKSIVESRESFWTFVILSHDKGSWTEDEIA